jgi:WD40 repeat protein
MTSAGIAPAPTELTTIWSRKLDDYVGALSVSRDGALVAVGSSAGRICAFEGATGSVEFDLEAHPGGVLACAFSPRASLLATSGHDGYARFFDASGHEQGFVSGGSAWVEHLAWSPSGNHLATASGRTARVWTWDAKPVFEIEPATTPISALAWNRIGTQLATAGYGGVRIADARRGSVVRELPWYASLISLAWSPDDSVIACGTQECSVHFWRLHTGKESEMSGFTAQPRALSWSRDGKLLATSGGPASSLWSFEAGPEGRRPTLLSAHQALCTALSFHPTLPWLASGGDDAAVFIWRPDEAIAPFGVGRMDDTVTSLAWFPTTPLLVASDASGLVRAFRVPHDRPSGTAD